MAKKPAEKVEFLYEGTNRQGKKVKGEIYAISEIIAKTTVRKQGINVLKIKKKAQPLFGAKKQKITPSDIAIFSRQLATMMKSGVPLVQSFDIIGMGHANPSMQNLIMAIKSDVEGGSNFAEALLKHPMQFDELFVNLVDAGEQSGALELMLDKLATYKEKTEAIKAKVKKAMNYPIAVLAIAFIVTAILLVFVVPQFGEIFASFGAELPAMTLFVIAISEFMQAYWWIFVLAIGAIIHTYKYMHAKSAEFRKNVDRIALKMPIIGEITTKSAIARFARTLETMSAAGVPLVEAMESVAGATGNIVYKEATLVIRDEISTGTQLQQSMKSCGLFPNMVIQMVAIGEEAGSLDFMLSKVADFYETEVDNAVDGLTALMEPLIMSVLGVLVGGLIVSMYLPIFQMGQVVG
ncbi:MAG: type II secretion system F family protein [Gammaproteobacteria bacterium]|nr:type II secretion system F family protein [Gammaproteobacteria bacterium]